MYRFLIIVAKIICFFISSWLLIRQVILITIDHKLLLWHMHKLLLLLIVLILRRIRLLQLLMSEILF